MIYLYIFLIIVAIKILLNLNNYFQIKKFYKKYSDFVKDSNWEFVEHQKKIIQLFVDAGVEDSGIPFVEPAGYNHVTATTVSFFKNLNNTREDVVGLAQKAFHISIGVYRQRMIDAVNPFYWVKLVIYLPKVALSYLGIKEGNITINIAQIVYWISTIIIGLLSLDNIELVKKIKLWLNSI